MKHTKDERIIDSHELLQIRHSYRFFKPETTERVSKKFLGAAINHRSRVIQRLLDHIEATKECQQHDS